MADNSDVIDNVEAGELMCEAIERSFEPYIRDLNGNIRAHAEQGKTHIELPDYSDPKIREECIDMPPAPSLEQIATYYRCIGFTTSTDEEGVKISWQYWGRWKGLRAVGEKSKQVACVNCDSISAKQSKVAHQVFEKKFADLLKDVKDKLEEASQQGEMIVRYEWDRTKWDCAPAQLCRYFRSSREHKYSVAIPKDSKETQDNVLNFYF